MRIKNVLLIDDDQDDREIFLQAINEITHKVSCVAMGDARTALRELVLRHTIPDVIFLDLNVPGMSGQEFMTHFNQHEELHTIPIIILSTSSDPHTISTTKSLGATAFITKPGIFLELVSILESTIAKENHHSAH